MKKQDQSCTYDNNTIIDNNKVDDNPANIAEITKEIFSCTNRGNKIRRRGRKHKHTQKHVKRNYAASLKLFSTNAAGLVKG